jgi:hypothetical protein
MTIVISLAVIALTRSVRKPLIPPAQAALYREMIGIRQAMDLDIIKDSNSIMQSLPPRFLHREPDSLPERQSGETYKETK